MQGPQALHSHPWGACHWNQLSSYSDGPSSLTKEGVLRA